MKIRRVIENSFFLLTISIFLSITPLTYAQDTTFQQVLGCRMNNVYYPYFFLGGTYYSRISLTDIDGDGDLDLFYGGGNTGSLVYFENVGDSHHPNFQLRYEEFPNLVNPEHEATTCDVDFADLDQDGDLDAAFSIDLDMGGSIRWNDGNVNVPDFNSRPPVGYPGQSSVTLVDIDNDGDYDYFSGYGARNTQLIYAENIGTPEVPQYVVRSYNYQNLFIDNHFNFDMGDIDGDGDYDLIACKLGGAVAYYENIGTAYDDSFVLVSDNFLPYRDTTDWLESPELADIDGDGDLDLFLAGGYNHLCYFENMGPNADTQFVQRYDTTIFYDQQNYWGSQLTNAVDINADGKLDFGSGENLFLNESVGNEIRLQRVDFGLPSYRGWFVDLDNDGDYDYITPSEGTIINYWENTGSPSSPSWAPLRDLFPADGHLDDVWSVATGDIDGDGDQDLFVGNASTLGVTFYRNTGTPDSFYLSYEGDMGLPGFIWQTAHYISPTDMDGDGDLDLFIADLYANNYDPVPIRLFYFRNDGTPQQPQWVNVTNDFGHIIRDHRQDGFSICPIDIDGDGDRDLLFSVAIGLQLYLNPEYSSGIENSYHQDKEIRLDLEAYPNPFNSTGSIGYDLPKASDITLAVFDILGRKVATLVDGHQTAGHHEVIWNAASFSSGVYFARASDKNNSSVIKLIYLK